jgi:hypothetical protein
VVATVIAKAEPSVGIPNSSKTGVDGGTRNLRKAPRNLNLT